MVLAPKDWDYPTLFLCVLCDIKFQIDFGQQMDVITLNNLILKLADKFYSYKYLHIINISLPTLLRS